MLSIDIRKLKETLPELCLTGKERALYIKC